MSNSIHYLFFFFLINYSLLGKSQCNTDTLRYKQKIFDSIKKHSNITYGEAPNWLWPYLNTNLEMDIFEPIEDSQSKRPLMIWLHPGGFALGNKNADDMVALCDSFARKGYVTASLEYRLGFNYLSGSSAERAVYRSLQDLNAGLRFLFEKSTQYGIDTNYVFIGGSSAGAVTVIQTVYMNQNEAPESISEDPDLGCLSCEGNEYNHYPKITGYVSLWGAIGDSTWITANENTPGLLIHGTEDGIVYYGVGSPFGYPLLREVHGTRSISNQLTSLQIPHQTIVKEGLGHEFHGATNGYFLSNPTNYWDTIYNAIQNHYAKLVIPELNQELIGKDSTCQYKKYTYTISNPNNYEICWQVTGGEIESSTNNSIDVIWNTIGEGYISYRFKNKIAGYSTSSFFKVYVKEGVFITSSEFIQEDSLINFSLSHTGGDSIHWDFGDGTYSNDESPTHIYQNRGNYITTVEIFNTNNCSFSKTFNISILSIEEKKLENINIFPNPTNESFEIIGIEGNFDLLIYDVCGKLIFREKKPYSNLFKIKANKGYYIVKLIKKNSQKTIPLIIK